MSLLAVRVAGLSAVTRDAVSAALFDAGALSVQEDRDELLTYLPNDASLDGVRRVVAAEAGAILDVREASGKEVDQEWPSTVGVSRAGPFAISPPWLTSTADAEIVISIDPAMAFGTGEHPTTRGVLRLIQHLVRPGDRVADLGTGSGVLAIAAARLGALRVAAIESDPEAIGNADENVHRNGVSDRVVVIEGHAETILPHVSPVHLVLANIVSSTLISLLPAIRAALTADGLAIFSGILVAEREEFVSALAKARWRVEREDIEDEWWTAVVRPA
jgi:ribosomal protein L11 methyltransferase